MAKKEITLGGGKTFIKPKDLTKGQVIKGHYLRTTIGKKFGKPEHELRTSEGDVTFNSAGKLDSLIQEGLDSEVLRPGDYIEIEYLGMEVMKGGNNPGKEAHQFKVSVIEDVAPIAVEEPVKEEAPKPRKNLNKVS